MIMKNLQHKLLRLPEVKATTGLSKSTIYARISEGTFPKQIPLGPRLVVWVESDIQNWISEQVSASRGNTPLFMPAHQWV
jgi:prophage regulatory protein